MPFVEVAMLTISLVFSFVMLAVTCGAAWAWREDRKITQIVWLFLLIPLCGFSSTIFLCNVVLVALGGIVYAFTAMRLRVFYAWALIATLLSYAAGMYVAYERIRREERQYPLESMAERLSYEGRRAASARRGGWAPEGLPSAETLARLESVEKDVKEGDLADPRGWPENRQRALRAIHEAKVDEFVNSPGFGVTRGYRSGMFVQPPQEFVVPLDPPDPATVEVSAGNTRTLSEALRAEAKDQLDRLLEGGWGLHRKAIVDFSNPVGFGYVKDRRHVAGFQAHQFSSLPAGVDGEQGRRWKLRRVELVSLLTHDEPVVYVTDRLPRMDLLRDVPVRSLDDFEAPSLPQLGRGEDVIALQTESRLRMLGAIRAGKQCLSCHDAQRGDLLGAFSYHFDPAR
jgi:hypothetical protein